MVISSLFRWSTALSIRPDWDEYFLSLCRTVAQRADCTRRQVGAVLVIDNRVVSTGYNGAPAGDAGCASAGACPRGKLTYDQQPANVGYSGGGCIAIHAEHNAILYAYRDLSDATMYCTDEPCVDCERFIRGAKIKRVVTPSGARTLHYPR